LESTVRFADVLSKLTVSFVADILTFLSGGSIATGDGVLQIHIARAIFGYARATTELSFGTAVMTSIRLETRQANVHARVAIVSMAISQRVRNLVPLEAGD
jgi:hypothetical protein